MRGLYLGDCLNVLKELSDNSVDSIVTDPPYGLSFMGKKWDYDVPDQAIWEECLRVLKPGGHLLAFAGTRTQHRMAVLIEDAGFEIRDMIAWVYGSGFPKSLDVSKAIDKAAGAEREVVGRSEATAATGGVYGEYGKGFDITAPATDATKQWQGWGTALKPALEPITVARKPFKGTVADNVLEWGTGAINIDGCRVRMSDGEKNPSIARYASTKPQGNNGWGHVNRGARFDDSAAASAALGRWPANLIHDGSDEPTELLGAAARFFYCAKASPSDRNEGCENMPLKNHHPTVKPTDLMRYLCRLVTPVGGTVLDPFMGSGSTGKAAKLEGFGFIGIERESDYFEIAKSRIAVVTAAGEGMV